MAGGSSDADNQDKTESPSQYRREEFRRKGSVASSKELTGILLLMGVAIALGSAGPRWLQTFRSLCDTFFRFDRVPELTRLIVVEQETAAIKALVQFTAPVFLTACLVGFVASAGQVGFYWTWEPLAPNWDRVNPFEGVKRLFSKQSLFDSGKSLFKMLIVGFVLYWTISKTLPIAGLLFEKSTDEIAAQTGQSLVKVLLSLCGALLTIAASDYAWSRYRLESQMKMTKKEAKDEMKLREGDPMMKARIRNLQRKIVSKRMMQEVPKADVIITNPTHFAIALKYNSDKMDAPRVVAKGVDFLALRIRELAKRSNVPIVENKPLARQLYRDVPVGRPINRELYKAVAQVLAYVYRLRQSAAGVTA